MSPKASSQSCWYSPSINRLVFSGVLIAFIIYLNSIIHFPDINDMMGLSRICLMMDDSLLYCANSNWGFAHPLLNYCLTLITGNLLISQRILSALFTVGAFFLCERIMITMLKLKKQLTMMVVLIVMALSPWAMDSILSVHLDIAGVFFVLCGLVMLIHHDKPHLILAGLLVSISIWFRFHYLIFTLLYPFLVYGINRRHHAIRQAGYTLIGIIPGLLIPYLLNYAAYGYWSISNQKMILALSTGLLKYENSFALQLENLSYSKMISMISWPLYLKQRWELLSEPMIMLPFIFIGVSFAIVLFRNFKLRSGKREKNPGCLLLWDTNEYKGLLIILYLILSVLPFILIRGLTFRLESALFIPFIPVLALILESSITRRYYLLLLIYLLISWNRMTLDYLDEMRNRCQIQERITRDVERVIPFEIRKHYYREILNGIEVYNRENPYLLFSPAVTGGWMTHSRPIADHFGRVDLGTLHQNFNYTHYRYIILPKRPALAFWQYDPRLLSQGTILAETRDLYILQPHR